MDLDLIDLAKPVMLGIFLKFCGHLLCYFWSTHLRIELFQIFFSDSLYIQIQGQCKCMMNKYSSVNFYSICCEVAYKCAERVSMTKQRLVLTLIYSDYPPSPSGQACWKLEPFWWWLYFQMAMWIIGLCLAARRTMFCARLSAKGVMSIFFFFWSLKGLVV